MKTLVVRPHALASALAAASLLTLAGPVARAQTLPSGLQVVSGQAQVARQGGAMTVTNSAGAVLNWSSFSIGADNSVRFEQPSTSSQVLNRVVGNDPSSIFGRLSSNGRVWLLNPNGVLFGESARVDVGGLVASTLRLNDDDWRAGRWSLAADARSAEIRNRGELRTTLGGGIALIGSSVRNDGLIEAPGGQIVLAAGAQVDLVDTGVPNLAVRVRSPAGEVTNLGRVLASGGRVDLYAAAVNQSGIVRADSLETGPGGEIVIRAGNGIDASPGSITSADGASAGGQVTLDAGDGRLSLSGTVSAKGLQGSGGAVSLLGREVGLLGAAQVDVTGASGGGVVSAGGGLSGKDARFANAQGLYFAPGASIRADALASGNGGRIVLWSDNATRAFGSLSARGGALGGDGGFIETSGGWLDARPVKVDVGAARGSSGRWLLDPYDILISDSAGTGNVDAGFTATGSPASINTSTINAALSAGTNVTISTGGSGAGSEPGEITLTTATLSVSSARPGSLTLIADGPIVSSALTIASSAPMPVTMLAGRAGGGGISLSGAHINTAGGDITLGGFGSADSAKPGSSLTNASVGSSFAPDGVHLSSGLLDAGGGNIALRGVGFSTIGSGVILDSGVHLNARNISINGYGVPSGVELFDAALTASNSISIFGSGGNLGVGIYGPSTVALVGSTPSGLLEVWGRVLSGDSAVVLDTTGSSSPLLSTTGGAAITVRADSCGCDADSLRLIGATGSAPPLADTTSGDGPITFGVYGDGNSIGATAVIIAAGRGTLTFDAGSFLGISDTLISSLGPVRLLGDSVTISGSTSIASSAGGDAIVVAGGFSPYMLSFFNGSGSGALNASGSGRWIVFANNVLDGEAFAPGGLLYDFKRHGANFGAWAGDSGNGFVFATRQVATVFGSVGSKVYDGTTTASVSGLSATGVEGESSSLRPGASLVFADKNAGTGKSLLFTTATPFDMIDSLGKPVFGYDFSTAGLKADITRRSASVSGLAVVPKVYDATTAATLGGTATFTGILPGDLVTVSGATGATFADKNVGTGKPVSLAGVVFGGPDGGNYSFASAATSLTGTITPRPVGLTGLTALDKVYDATTVATITGTPAIAALGKDAVFVAGTPVGAFGDKNVGSSKPVSVAGLSLGGTDAGNYTLTGASGLAASINPRPLVVSGLTAADKVYDAATVAVLSGSGSVTPLAGDAVSVSGTPTGAFADKNVGTAKPVTLTGATLTGADAGNYRAVASTSLSATITPRPIAATGLEANDKTYDGTTAATFSGHATVAALTGDVVTVAGTPVGSFADKNAGHDKPVSVSGLTLAGADAANYTLLPLTGLVADITAALVHVSGLSALSKVYDATTGATLSGTPVLDVGAPAGLTLSGTASGHFADKNVGTGKPVTVDGLALSGPDASNFQVEVSGLRADISPLVLSVAGIRAADKVYDATTVAALVGTAGVTGLPGDSVSLSGALAGRFADKNVGAGKPVTVSGLDLVGADAGNYRLSSLASLTASITPRPIAVGGLAALDKAYDATTTAALAGSPSIAPLAGDALSLAGSATGRFADKNAGAGKPVTVSGLSLAGADAPNYALQPVGGLSATISPLAVPVTGLSSTPKVYDGTTTAPISGTPAFASLAGDVVTLAGTASGVFGDRNVGTAKAITIGGLTLAGADAANYRIVLPALRGDVTPATLLYVATPIERLLGQPIGAVGGTLSGFASGDNAGNATTGSLAFTTPAVTGSPVGTYPIVGSGLSASNYRLDQSPGNASALSIVRLPPSTAADSGASLGVDVAVQTGVPRIPVPNPATGGVADLTDGVIPPPGGGTPTGAGALVSLIPGTGPATAGAGTTTAGGSGVTTQSPAAPGGAPTGSGSLFGSSAAGLFDPILIAGLSTSQMQDVLGARDRYKQSIFRDAITQLERDPALADLPPCASLEQAQAGTCLVTEELKQSYTQKVRVAQAAASPAASPAAAPPPAPAAALAPAAAPAAPSPAPAPAQTATAPPTVPQAALPEVIPYRRVLTAALPQIERKVALVVGVDAYRDPTIPTLANATRDARSIARQLGTDLGYETFVLPDASRASMVAALNRLALELQPHDSVVVYYAGHGQLVEATKLGYWQLSDADPKDPRTWLSNTDITRLIGRFGASQVAVISDSCYSGSLVPEERLRAGGAPVDPAGVLARKSVVVMSSGGNEPVFDDGKQGHSPFAFNLMNTLHQVQRWQAGGQIFERVRFAVARELPQRPQYGVSAAAGHQPGGDYLFETREMAASP